MLARAAERLHASFHVGVEGTRHRDRTACGENNFGGLGGELAACVGRACLHDDRPALNWTRDIQRTAHFQKLAMMIEYVELLRIEVLSRLDVANERVVGPAIPQARHDVEEFARATVTRRMLHVLLEAEIQRLVRIARRHHVPSGAPAADVIERREFPRDVIRLVVSGRRGRDKPEVFSEHGERGQQRQRIE